MVKMSVENLVNVHEYPKVILGGMGIAVSNWRLAGEVAANGGVGVVSGTASGIVMARRLQNGDMDDGLRQALAEFPDQRLVDSVMERYYLSGGRQDGQPYRSTSKFNLPNNKLATDLNILGAFTEVRRAQLYAQKQVGDYSRRQPIGINLLSKLALPAPSALFGAMLAGVDSVFVGAGIPVDVPAALDSLASGKPTSMHFDVTNAGKKHFEVDFNPANYPRLEGAPITRPAFLAIIASNSLAKYLAKQARPDGFVVEGPTAGGHNAPPRGTIEVDETRHPFLRN